MFYQEAINNLKPLHVYIKSTLKINDLKWITFMCDNKLDDYIYPLEITDRQTIFNSFKKLIEHHKQTKDEIDFDGFLDFLDKHRKFYGM